MGLGLSTSWNAFRCQEAKKLIEEIGALGFQEIELSFNLSTAIIEDITKLFPSEKIGIVSLHNYCPAPEDLSIKEALPDCYSLASINEEERRKAVKYTKRTIDTAHKLGAKAVVVHAGRVEMPDATRDLIALYLKTGKNNKDFQKLRDDFLGERERRARPFFEKALSSLEELARYTEDKNISIGLENRFYCREIPSFGELSLVLNKLKGSRIHYWHDTGHARIMESLGVVGRGAYLQAYGRNMCGIHIHNVLNCQDHRAPQAGEINFRELSPYLTKNTLKIIEAHYPATAQELIEAKRFLETLLDGRL